MFWHISRTFQDMSWIISNILFLSMEYYHVIFTYQIQCSICSMIIICDVVQGTFLGMMLSYQKTSVISVWFFKVTNMNGGVYYFGVRLCLIISKMSSASSASGSSSR